MRYLKARTYVLLATPMVVLGFFLMASCATRQKAPAPVKAPPGAPVMAPGPNDPRIGYVTARLLETYDFTQRHLDQELSKRFFDGYVDSLDPRHENFLQTDLEEFSGYRTNLDKLTIGGPEGVADLTPAFKIYHRYVERLQQHTDFVKARLNENHFKFTSNDRIAIDRRHEPYPKDLAAAEALWDQQIDFEYLMEKLSQEIIITNDNFTVRLPKTAATNITDTLTHRYQRNLHYFTNWDSTDVLQAYLNGLTHAYDPHSDFFNLEHAQDFSISMNLSLFGIGAQLEEDDGFCRIKKLIVGGPADKSKKLNENDRVVGVAQGTNPPVNVVGMELGKVVQLIRGPKGTEVRLTTSPAADRATRNIVTLVRDEIKLDDQAAKARLIEMPDDQGGVTRLGVIDLPSFYATVGTPGGQASPKYTSVDVARLVKKLKQEQVNGIILDLRSNPGGSLEEAVRFTGLFIKDGPVVQARSSEGVTVDTVPDPGQLYDGPLAVMINRYSASASEIAAAALQDYDRAIIVGDSSTFGKGTVQQLNQLRPLVWPATPTATNDPGELKVTIRKFYRISGASTQFKGVTSDIILPDPLDFQKDIQSETTLDNPLPWDTIAGTPYNKFNLVRPYLAELGKKSAARTATNPDFIYLREEIEQTKKHNADRTLTLNEREAIQERQTNHAKQKAREAEITARRPANMKVYEITLADAAKPGLPAPSYYPGILETNETTTVTSNHLAVVRQEFIWDDNLSSFFADTNSAVADTASAVRQMFIRDGSTTSAVHQKFIREGGTNLVFTTNAIPRDSTTNGLFTIKTIKVKKQPDLDPLLQETDHIMQDYISLLSQKGGLTTKQ